MLKIGEKAPEFCLIDQNGLEHNLNMYKGKKVLLYFYPKDNTPGCTLEACSFRDSKLSLDDMQLIVLGISKDNIDSHKKFSEKYDLNFPILSDTDGKIINTYEAWGKKKFMGREYEGILRISYLINEDGYIEKVFDKVNTKTHALDVISSLD